jgi:hypothetical protein
MEVQCDTETYCNVLVGSISQWNFIAFKVQYKTVDYSRQLYNTRPNSTSSLNTTHNFIRSLSIYHNAITIVTSLF